MVGAATGAQAAGPRPVVGVLALQGSFAEHVEALAALGVGTRLVRRPADLEGLGAIILPGGESTAMGRLLSDFALLEPLRAAVAGGLPAWGTCAGAILLARSISNDSRRHLALMDLEVERNAYGAQLESFRAAAPIAGLEGGDFPLVFIRAPAFVGLGLGVEPLASSGGKVVACRQGTMVATAFHPELSGDRRFHRWFLEQVAGLSLPAAGSGDGQAA